MLPVLGTQGVVDTGALPAVNELCLISAYSSYQGRLNELMSQIRMQNHFGAVRAEERYYIDADLLREIKQVSMTG